ncbi:NmrA-like family protein [Parathielavia appendiculata]|uniref:NmrA-like family domain-containing protein 1 n=1 Tax=Parathielavia appendiculata TaxID=2587402 RepID=A0AAN6Z3Y0_9PEZI|nr:NmrA-like family protein [Parathielavia appendiculata]
MTGKKIITVFGATGAQGGAVADTFLHDAKLKSDWTVRAVTRNTTSEAAQKLKSQGAEVVAADLNDKATLLKAVEGASAVFAVTNYWEKADHELELRQGKALVDAAKDAGVHHFIWSSLINVSKLSNGKLPHVYHFDSKAQVEEYARGVGLPATFFLPGFYMSNIPGGMLRPNPDRDNAWTFSLPVPATAPIPVFDPADTGKYVKAAVLHRDAVLSRRILGATAYLTGTEIVEGFKKVFPEAGETATYRQQSEAEYLAALTGKGTPEFIAQELLENMLLLDQFGYYGGASLDETHALIEDELTTWEDYVRKSTKWPADLK